MKKIIIAIFLCISLCGCDKNDIKQVINEAYIEKIVLDKEYIILDVRTKEEYEELHIIDAINIALNEIDENIKIDREKIIFVYCKSGNRSNMAYNTLTNLGYTVYDLGGIDSINLEKE
ncbi:MAG: rhodanese-like domain-containing protein [Bacilli bacterium]|nr:rhodanese-like domain-containing protein [Bacilli bacterium]